MKNMGVAAESMDSPAATRQRLSANWRVEPTRAAWLTATMLVRAVPGAFPASSWDSG